MKVGPLVRPQHRPAAILVPSNRSLEVTTTTGTHTYNGAAKVHEAMAQLRGHSCYVLKGLTQLIHTTGALSWQCHLWRGRETRMVHNASGTSVTVTVPLSLRLAPCQPEPEPATGSEAPARACQ